MEGNQNRGKSPSREDRRDSSEQNSHRIAGLSAGHIGQNSGQAPQQPSNGQRPQLTTQQVALRQRALVSRQQRPRQDQQSYAEEQRPSFTFSQPPQDLNDHPHYTDNGPYQQQQSPYAQLTSQGYSGERRPSSISPQSHLPQYPHNGPTRQQLGMQQPIQQQQQQQQQGNFLQHQPYIPTGQFDQWGNQMYVYGSGNYQNPYAFGQQNPNPTPFAPMQYGLMPAMNNPFHPSPFSTPQQSWENTGFGPDLSQYSQASGAQHHGFQDSVSLFNPNQQRDHRSKRARRSRSKSPVAKKKKQRTVTGELQVPRAELLCKWCKKQGHAAGDCQIPDADGFLPVCPKCHNLEHLYHGCPYRKEKEERFFFGERRDGKCPLKWHKDVRTISGFEVDGQRPHTAAYAKKLLAEGYYQQAKYGKNWKEDEKRDDPAYMTQGDMDAAVIPTSEFVAPATLVAPATGPSFVVSTVADALLAADRLRELAAARSIEQDAVKKEEVKEEEVEVKIEEE